MNQNGFIRPNLLDPLNQRFKGLVLERLHNGFIGGFYSQ
jgi:hypothetical protein